MHQNFLTVPVWCDINSYTHLEIEADEQLAQHVAELQFVAESQFVAAEALLAVGELQFVVDLQLDAAEELFVVVELQFVVKFGVAIASCSAVVGCRWCNTHSACRPVGLYYSASKANFGWIIKSILTDPTQQHLVYNCVYQFCSKGTTVIGDYS